MDNYLDILGQQHALCNLYTQLCFCFSLADTTPDFVIETLTAGLERLSASFPWVAGKVVNDRIEPFEKTPKLIVKDLSHIPLMSMLTLRQANFPMSLLDENIIAPCKTFSGPMSESPVFLLQANFIIGGLILTFNGHHQAMDMTGQSQIIKLLSKACHNNPFTVDELSSGNLPRRNLIPLLDDADRHNSRLDPHIAKSFSSTPDICPSTWTYFNFSSTSLAALKSLAVEFLSSGYISTDDALSAFIWQSITRARLYRLDPTTESTFSRAVDARRYLNIPQTYPGVIQNMTYHTHTFQNIVTRPLGNIASSLRSAVDPKTSDVAYRTRALATALSHSSDENSISVTANVNISTDIMLSSWANVLCYDLDFNLGLGYPEAVRRPLFDPFESLVYLMPKTPDGEIAVAICLRNTDMDRLKTDEVFSKYAKYVG